MVVGKGAIRCLLGIHRQEPDMRFFDRLQQSLKSRSSPQILQLTYHLQHHRPRDLAHVTRHSGFLIM